MEIVYWEQFFAISAFICIHSYFVFRSEELGFKDSIQRDPRSHAGKSIYCFCILLDNRKTDKPSSPSKHSSISFLANSKFELLSKFDVVSYLAKIQLQRLPKYSLVQIRWYLRIYLTQGGILGNASF